MTTQKINTTITITLKEYASLKVIETAARGLIDYRDRNVLNWQLEKADAFIGPMRISLDALDGDK